MAAGPPLEMDLLRVRARGQLSEILAPHASHDESSNRRLRLAPHTRDATLLDPNLAMMEAYARGVNQFHRAAQKESSLEFSLLRYDPSLQPSDTLTISAI